MFKGSKGFLVGDFESRVLLPYGDNADLTYYKPRAPDKVLPPLGHFQKQWINACKKGGKTACDFEYSGNMIEQLLLGLVAYRVGKKIHYDGAEGRVTDCPEADELLRRKYRSGLDAGRLGAGTRSESATDPAQVPSNRSRCPIRDRRRPLGHFHGSLGARTVSASLRRDWNNWLHKGRRSGDPR